MTVSARRFLREFPTYRRQAEMGKTVLVSSRKGVTFSFQRIGKNPRPRPTEHPLPVEITSTWDIDTPASAPDEWEANR